MLLTATEPFINGGCCYRQNVQPKTHYITVGRRRTGYLSVCSTTSRALNSVKALSFCISTHPQQLPIMAERDGPPSRRPADVPSLAEKGQMLQGREGDFAILNKQLRACFVCKLIKATPQWMDNGCDNCRWMDLSDMESLDQCTTTNFSGLMTLMEPPTSWVAKWTHTAKCVPGCYALSINDEMPRRLQEMLENRGIRVHR